MQLDSQSIVTISFGAVMVGIYSWSRFDEPSCDSQSEHFARYKPRFSTSYGHYARAKMGYVFAIVLVYFIVSLVPELYLAFTGSGAKDGQSASVAPMGVALGIIALQNIPVLKDLECRIRGILHSFARIPECVRRTVARMRSSPFTFPPDTVHCLTRKLNLPANSNFQLRASMNHLLVDDDLLHVWYSVGCVLNDLSEKNQDKTGIDPLFFDFYRDELDGIAARHAALAGLVREHVTSYVKSRIPGGSDNTAETAEPTALRELRDLRERLYTFVACGVHSSVSGDGRCLEIVAQLGFNITPDTQKRKSVIGPLVGLSVIALLVLSTFASVWTQAFDDLLRHRATNGWRNAFPMIPDGMPGYFIWSCLSAMFYFAAVFGALAVRNARIIKREWFDLNNLQRERPILRYVMPTLFGTALGCVTLLMISVVGGTGFKDPYNDLSKAFVQSLPWFPLATVIAFIACMLSDSPPENETFWRSAIFRAACGASAMALVGVLMSYVSVSTALKAFAGERQIPAGVTVISFYVELFIASQIALLTFVLCIVMQVAERYIARTQCLAGRYIDIVTRQGPEFCVFFDKSGEASLLAANGSDVTQTPPRYHGQWQMFPEGTSVKWEIGAGEPGFKAGSYGLISGSGDSMIYEGCAEQFSGRADFVGQVRVRTNGRTAVAAVVEPPETVAPTNTPAPPATAASPKLPKPPKANHHRKPRAETKQTSENKQAPENKQTLEKV